MKIGVFDSGVGGEAVAASLRNVFSHVEIDSINDRKNMPYGNKNNEEIISLTTSALQPFLDGSYQLIVIACNTATAVALTSIRQQYPNQSFIGLEPMIKPATSLTKTSTIAVCATPATFNSQRYLELKASWAQKVTVIEPDCSTWATMIESDTVNQQEIDNVIDDCLRVSADVIVLACTHYHWIKTEIERKVGGKATVLDPTEAIANRIKTLLATTKL